MKLSEGIRKIGFRRWYERQLIESHLYFVSSFLCLIAVMAALEGFSFRGTGWEPMLRIAVIAGGAIACFWTLRRYLSMLHYAQFAAERSVCDRCSAYGGLELNSVIAGVVHEDAPRDADASVSVRCTKCGHQWTLV
jgi:hypothetical protein